MKPILISLFLLLSFVGWGQCKVVVTSDEDVIVHLGLNGSGRQTIVLTQGDECEIYGKEETKDGRVIYHGRFKDENDDGRIKKGIIVSNGVVWGRKIDPDCELKRVVVITQDSGG